MNRDPSLAEWMMMLFQRIDEARQEVEALDHELPEHMELIEDLTHVLDNSDAQVRQLCNRSRQIYRRAKRLKKPTFAK